MSYVVPCNNVVLRTESSKCFQNPTLSVVSNSGISIAIMLPEVMAGYGKYRGGVACNGMILYTGKS